MDTRTGSERRSVTDSGGTVTPAVTVLPQLRAIFQGLRVVPPAGFEPALTAPEAVALSPELRGLKDRSKATSPLIAPRVVRTAAAGRRDQDHLAQVVARTSQ